MPDALSANEAGAYKDLFAEVLVDSCRLFEERVKLNRSLQKVFAGAKAGFMDEMGIDLPVSFLSHTRVLYHTVVDLCLLI